MRAGVWSACSSRRARYLGVGRHRRYTSMTGPGMSIHRSVETSWRMSDSGNSGVSRSGVTGSPVPGWSGRRGGTGRSGMMLYQAVGMSSGARLNTIRSLTTQLLSSVPLYADYPPHPAPRSNAACSSGPSSPPMVSPDDNDVATKAERLADSRPELARLQALAGVAGAAAHGGGLDGVL